MNSSTQADNNKYSELFQDLQKGYYKLNLLDQSTTLSLLYYLTRIERLLQDLDEKPSKERIPMMNKGIEESLFYLTKWKKLLHEYQEITVESVYAFNASLHTIAELLGLIMVPNFKADDVSEKISELNQIFPWSENAKMISQLYIADEARKHEGDLLVENLNNLLAEDTENKIYLWNAEVWIDTNNAFTANKFMHLLSSTLSYIDDLEIMIEEAKVGSFFQKWNIKINGIFTKKRTVDVVNKSLKAAEAYLADRHIAPVELAHMQTLKAQEEIRRFMSEEQIKEIHELTLVEKREDVKAKRLANLEKQLELEIKLSDYLAKGLIEFDDDYRLMLNNILVMEQKQKRFTFHPIEDNNNSDFI